MAQDRPGPDVREDVHRIEDASGAGVPEPRRAPDDEVPGREPKKRRRLRTVLLAGLGVVVLLAAAGVVGVELTSRRVLGNVERIPQVFAPLDEAKRPQKPTGTDKTLNVLLVGVDSGDPRAARSDAIMLVHVAADRRSAAFVSIPRDAWVAVPDRGPDPISSAYASGGPSLLVRTVEQLTALRVDHFAVLDFAGFGEITDTVGGADVRVRRATPGFPAGTNHLDGDAAVRYVRLQGGGDAERARRQQQVMKALLTEAGRIGISSPAKTLHLLESVARTTSVDDSLSNGRMRSLALALRNLRPDQVDFVTAPVSPARAGDKRTRLDPARASGLWDAMVRDDVAGYLSQHPDLTT
jgi:LCP family protein required for cell wall assembly